MKAALYVRVSTSAQAEKWSLPAQERALTEHCGRQGWQFEVFEDAGISGETLDARPAMLRLLKDVQAGRFDLVLAVELERFSRSRDLFDWLTIRKTFREAGVRWGTPAQVFAPDDAEDAFLSILFGALSAREKEKFVARSKRGKDQAARGDGRRPGRYIAAWRTYGYAVQDGQLVVKEDEAAVVRRIFAMNSDGRPIREIARTLTSEGVPTPRRAIGHPVHGRAWRPSSVYSILTNPTYTGRWFYGRERMVDGKRLPQPTGDWICVTVPRIVPDADFDLAVQRTKRNAATARRNKKRAYPLAGLVWCARCGARMYGRVRGGRRRAEQRYYRCARRCDGSHYVRADDLEGLVWREVVRGLRQPELVLAEIARQREARFGQRDEGALRLDTVRAALAKLPAERERVSLQHQEGYMPWTEAKTRLEEIRRRQADFEEEAARLEATLTTTALSTEQDGDLRAFMDRFAARLDSLTVRERMTVLQGVVQRVAVAPDMNVTLDTYLPARVPSSTSRA